MFLTGDISMPAKKKNSKSKKVESNTEWLDKVINQLTTKLY